MSPYSGLFDGVHAAPHSLLTNKTDNDLTMLARVLSGSKRGNAATKAKILALTGAVVGGTATETVKQVQHSAEPGVSSANGGMRTIETKELINRVTTSDDLAEIDAALNLSSKPSSYPVDLSGNGGGGKLS